jgi:2-dehydro-3-deoxyphosphogluconate aldolase / (4S)-4-hydroxy-2-oxoglutarate aldolase
MSDLDSVTAAVVRSGVVAVLRAPTADSFAAVADVLVESGVTAIEVTLTSRGAINALAGLRRQLPPSAVIGAGTVLTADDAKAAVDAGAAFLVSPLFDPLLFDPELGGSFGVPFYPGGLTPTEIFAAHRSGAPLVKLFPAATVGPRYIKDLHAPLPDVRIMPTGGIDIADIATWLGNGASAVGLGSPLLGDSVTGGNLRTLAERARRAADAVAFARS